MQNQVRSSLNSEEWVTIRDFTDDDTGYTKPRYEAKYVEDVDRQYIDTEIVLVKKTNSITGGEQITTYPREIFEGVVEQLP